MVAAPPPPPTDPLEGSEQASNWQLIRRLLGMSWTYRWRCVIVLTLQLAVVALSLWALNLAGLGIDYIHHQVTASIRAPQWPLGLTPPEGWTPMGVIVAVATAVLAMALLRAALEFIGTLAQATLVQDLIVDLRSAVYNKLQRLSFHFFDASESGSIINRVTTDVQQVRMFLDGVVLRTIVLLMSVGVYLTYMLSTHVTLTLACLATTPLLYMVSAAYGRSVKPAYRKNRESTDDLVRVLKENVQGRHVVKGFALQGQEIDKFKAANDHVRGERQWITWRISFFQPTVQVLAHVNLIVLLGYGGYLVTAGQLQLGQDLVVFAGLLQALSNQVSNIAQISNSVQQSLTGAQRVFEVLDAPLDITNPHQPTGPEKIAGRVRFEGVSFGYRENDTVLDNVSFEAPAGSCVAIVGATGAGKSTLLSLIPRFYDPRHGAVTIDGVDVREIDLDQLRRSVGIVFQENFLFSNTIAANIAFGHPEATREQIERAARVAAAHEFIVKLSSGYDTVIGENGTDLSGGQRQRLAIARAVLLEPAILLLDDATAAVDPETEHEIMTAMDNAMRGRTTFVVAHRLSTLRRADYVVVLEKGRVVQSGTHERLMQDPGLYRRAARLQQADAESKRLLGVPDREEDNQGARR